jgi:hypothetical protein
MNTNDKIKQCLEASTSNETQTTQLVFNFFQTSRIGLRFLKKLRLQKDAVHVVTKTLHQFIQFANVFLDSQSQQRQVQALGSFT